jgi:hypothetical protein
MRPAPKFNSCFESVHSGEQSFKARPDEVAVGNDGQARFRLHGWTGEPGGAAVDLTIAAPA